MKQIIKYAGIIASIIAISGCFYTSGYYHHNHWNEWHCVGHHTYCR